jgi:hypothetical protein
MVTTVQISESTKQLLDSIKEEEEAETFDEVVNHLAHEHLKIPRSMHGSAKGLRPWTKEDRVRFREL